MVEEKAVRLEKDAREYSERAEEAQLREVEEKQKQKVRDRERGNTCSGTAITSARPRYQMAGSLEKSE
jgi:hypothetical protein